MDLHEENEKVLKDNVESFYLDSNMVEFRDYFNGLVKESLYQININRDHTDFMVDYTTFYYDMLTRTYDLLSDKSNFANEMSPMQEFISESLGYRPCASYPFKFN